jgi:alkylated DNA repair dioxygenase AlkB
MAFIRNLMFPSELDTPHLTTPPSHCIKCASELTQEQIIIEMVSDQPSLSICRDESHKREHVDITHYRKHLYTLHDSINKIRHQEETAIMMNDLKLKMDKLNIEHLKLIENQKTEKEKSVKDAMQPIIEIEQGDSIATAFSKDFNLAIPLIDIVLSQMKISNALPLLIKLFQSDTWQQKLNATVQLLELYNVFWTPIVESEENPYQFGIPVLDAISNFMILFQDRNASLAKELTGEKFIPVEKPLHNQSLEEPTFVEQIKSWIDVDLSSWFNSCPMGTSVVALLVMVLLGGGVAINKGLLSRSNNFISKVDSWCTSMTSMARGTDALTKLWKVVHNGVKWLTGQETSSMFAERHRQEVAEYATTLKDLANGILTNPEKIIQDVSKWYFVKEERDRLDKIFINQSKCDMNLAALAPMWTSINHSYGIVDRFFRSAIANSSVKQEPYVIWCYGKPGHGKSYYNQHLIRSICKEVGWPDSIYIRSTGTEHWNNYHGQTGFMYDEYGNIKAAPGQPSSVEEMNYIYSPAAWNPPQAALPAKDIMFTSKIGGLNSNEATISAQASNHLSTKMMARRCDEKLHVTNPAVEKLTPQELKRYNDDIEYKATFFKKDYSHLVVDRHDPLDNELVKANVTIDEIIVKAKLGIAQKTKDYMEEVNKMPSFLQWMEDAKKEMRPQNAAEDWQRLLNLNYNLEFLPNSIEENWRNHFNEYYSESDAANMMFANHLINKSPRLSKKIYYNTNIFLLLGAPGIWKTTFSKAFIGTLADKGMPCCFDDYENWVKGTPLVLDDISASQEKYNVAKRAVWDEHQDEAFILMNANPDVLDKMFSCEEEKVSFYRRCNIISFEQKPRMTDYIWKRNIPEIKSINDWSNEIVANVSYVDPTKDDDRDVSWIGLIDMLLNRGAIVPTNLSTAHIVPTLTDICKPTERVVLDMTTSEFIKLLTETNPILAVPKLIVKATCISKRQHPTKILQEFICAIMSMSRKKFTDINQIWIEFSQLKMKDTTSLAVFSLEFIDNMYMLDTFDRGNMQFRVHRITPKIRADPEHVNALSNNIGEIDETIKKIKDHKPAVVVPSKVQYYLSVVASLARYVLYTATVYRVAKEETIKTQLYNKFIKAKHLLPEDTPDDLVLIQAESMLLDEKRGRRGAPVGTQKIARIRLNGKKCVSCQEYEDRCQCDVYVPIESMTDKIQFDLGAEIDDSIDKAIDEKFYSLSHVDIEQPEELKKLQWHDTSFKNRKAKWFGSFDYHHTNETFPATPCPEWLTEIEDQLINQGIDFPDELRGNCYINYYPTRNSYLGKHSDRESVIDQTQPIVSLSFGSPQQFNIFKGNLLVQKFFLGQGDCFVMKPGFQNEFYHSVSTSDSTKFRGRYSLTWRAYLAPIEHESPPPPSRRGTMAARKLDRVPLADRMNHEASIDKNAREILETFSTSIVEVLGENDIRKCYGFVPKGKIGVTVAHATRGDTVKIRARGHIYNARIVNRNDTRDYAVFRLPKECETFPDMLNHVPEKIYELDNNQYCMIGIPKEKSFIIQPLVVGGLATKTVDSVKKYGYSYRGVTSGLLLASDLGTSPGYCGLPIIMCNKNVDRKMFAMHNAGNEEEGLGTIITSDMFNILDNESDPDDITILSYQCVERSDHFVDDETQAWGLADFPQYTPRKSCIYKSIFHGIMENQHEPAPLSSQDPRTDGTDWTLDGVKRFIHQQPDMDMEDLEIATREVAHHYANTIKVNNIQTPVLTKKQAINRYTKMDKSQPINMSTSMGYPWTQYKSKGKRGFFKFNEVEGIYNFDYSTQAGQHLNRAVDEKLRAARQGKKTATIFNCVPKDEVLSFRKIYDVKTHRVIQAAPADEVICDRMYNHTAVCAIMECRNQLAIKVGMDPLSVEWNSMWHTLTKISDHGFDIDFTNWDACFPLQVMQAVPHVYNAIYQLNDPNWKPEDDLIRIGLHKSVEKPLFLYREHVIQVPGGQPSGQPKTTMDNCVGHDILDYYIWRRLCKRFNKLHLISYREFLILVKRLIFGDDNLTAVDHEISSWYNFQTVQEEFLKIGMKCTSAAKDDSTMTVRPLTQCEFLKRQTVYKFGRYWGRLLLKSISKPLNWSHSQTKHYWHEERDEININESDMDSMISQICYELWGYGETYYNEITSKMTERLAKFNIKYVIPSFHSIQEELMSY